MSTLIQAPIRAVSFGCRIGLFALLAFLVSGFGYAQSAEDEVRAKAFEMMAQSGEQLAEAIGFALEASENDTLQRNIQTETDDALPGCGRIFSAYQTRTISLSGGGTLLVFGGDYEGGVAFRCGGGVVGRDNAKFFGSGALALRLGVSANAAVNVGHWKVPYNGLRGRSVGFEIGISDLLNSAAIAREIKDKIYDKIGRDKSLPVSLGVTYWWENTGGKWKPSPGAYQGFVISVIADTGVDLGVGLVTAKTVQFCDNDSECTLGLWSDENERNVVRIREHVFDPDETKPNLELGDHYFVADIDSDYLNVNVKEKTLRGQPLDWSDYREKRGARVLYRMCFRDNYTKLVLSTGGGVCNNRNKVTLTLKRPLNASETISAKDYRGYWHGVTRGRTRYIRIVEQDTVKIVIEEYGVDGQRTFRRAGPALRYVGPTGAVTLSSGDLQLIEGGRATPFDRNTYGDNREMIGDDRDIYDRLEGTFFNATINGETIYEELVEQSIDKIVLRRAGSPTSREFHKGSLIIAYKGAEGLLRMTGQTAFLLDNEVFRKNTIEDNVKLARYLETLGPVSGPKPNPERSDQVISVLGSWSWMSGDTRKTNVFVSQTDTQIRLRDRRNPLKSHTYKKTAPNTYRHSSGSQFEFRTDTILVWTSQDGDRKVIMRRD